MALTVLHAPLSPGIGTPVLSSALPNERAPIAFVLLFFFTTLKPRVECYTKSLNLKRELASEPLHISVKKLSKIAS
jgi:hypothetical protein